MPRESTAAELTGIDGGGVGRHPSQNDPVADAVCLENFRSSLASTIQIPKFEPRSIRRAGARSWWNTSPRFEHWVDWVVDIVSTPAFVAVQTLVILGYAVLNSLILGTAFDPYPYIFLNLILSMSSAYTSSIVLNSQRRQDRQAVTTSQAILSSMELLRKELTATEQRLDARERHLAERERVLTDVLRRLQAPGQK
jgi:hypothetical protein